MRKNFHTERGFTLIELMASLALFAVVVTVSLGSILGIFSANRKSRALKAVMTNLNLAVETMSREMRYGSRYHCGASGTLTTPQNCQAGDSLVSFLSSDNVQITYRLNGTTFEKQEGSAGWIPVTSPEVVIDQLSFYTLGAATGDGHQPKTLVSFRGHAGTGAGRSDFTLETLVSQRTLDN